MRNEPENIHFKNVPNTNNGLRSSKLTDGQQWTKVNKVNTPPSNEDVNSFKFFTGTTKSVKFFSNKIAHEKNNFFGAYLYEMIGMFKLYFS